MAGSLRSGHNLLRVGNGRQAHASTQCLNDNLADDLCTCRQRHETGKVSAGPHWQGSGP